MCAQIKFMRISDHVDAHHKRAANKKRTSLNVFVPRVDFYFGFISWKEVAIWYKYIFV